jgi:hypothetical protein
MVMRPSDGKSRVNEASDFIYIKPEEVDRLLAGVRGL